MNVSDLSRSLSVDEHGIWRSPRESAIAYPEDGNSTCFQLEDASYWFRHRNECIAAIVRQYAPGGPIVDVGGGNGFVTKRLIDEGHAALLLEPGATGALNARRHRQVPHVVCATLQNSDFRPNCFAAAGMFDVLEHIEDDRGFLQHIHGILRSDGLLYATVPAHQWLWSSADVSAEHYRRYNERTLTSVLAQGGFEVVYFTYFFQALTVPLYLLRTVPHRLGISKQDTVLNTATEHGASGGIGATIMTKLLRREMQAIERGRSLRTGTSCLVVARKKTSARQLAA